MLLLVLRLFPPSLPPAFVPAPAAKDVKDRTLLLLPPLTPAGAAGPAARALTDLSDPLVDWCRLAEGFGVPAAAATTVGEFERELRAALGRDGPSLIEALLP